MLIAADTHVHVYPCHEPGGMIAHAIQCLDNHAGDVPHVNVLCLSERRDCRWFAELCADGGESMLGGYSIRPAASPHALIVSEGDVPRLYVLAGRQVVTAEGVEMLSLACGADVAEGAPAEQTVQAILSAGGVPVVGWAPGKWLFSRGRVVRALIDGAKRDELLIGDTVMRPQGTPEPSLMARARSKGLSVIAGSDPLPMGGEDQYVGTYCSLFDGEFDPQKPAESVRRALTSSAVRTIGRRCSIVQSFVRSVRLRLSR